MAISKLINKGKSPSLSFAPQSLLQAQLGQKPLFAIPGNERNNSIVYDVTGNDRHAVNVSATHDQMSLDGKIPSMGFNGSAYLVMFHSPWHDVNDFTAEALVRTTSSVQQTVMGKWWDNVAASCLWIYGFAPSYKSDLGVVNTSGTMGSTYNQGIAKAPNTIYHYCATYNSSTGKVANYINGELWTEASVTGPMRTKVERFAIGRKNSGGHGWVGQMSHFAMYNKALPPERLKLHASLAGLI